MSLCQCHNDNSSDYQTRGYSISYLRKVKRDTLYDLNSTGQSRKCGRRNCSTCPHIKETSIIYDKNENPVSLKNTLDCQSRDIVYLIECASCGMRYVGETTQRLKDRINQHRSDINREQTTAVAMHFTGQCGSINFLKVIPIEAIQRQIPAAYTPAGIPDRCDRLFFLQREQFWMKKLNTLSPDGMNIRKELCSIIPLTLKFSDFSHQVKQVVKPHYQRIQELYYGAFHKHHLVTAYKRNHNLQDLLVRAKLG